MTGPNRAPQAQSALRSGAVAIIALALLALWSCGKGRAPGDHGTGSIKVNSAPSVAAIWLDSTGTEKTTPCLLTDVTAGEHTLRLTKDGYADRSSTVAVTAARTTTVDAVLSQSFGAIQVNSAPWGAAIRLDGANTAKVTPYLFSNVAVGEHRLELSEVGYPPWDSTVAVGDGQTVVVKASMKPPPDTQWVTYANVGDRYWATWLGPERAVRFNPGDFGFGYPLYVKKVSAVFYQWSGNLWPDSSFHFKVYGGDGRTLLYQSLTMEAKPGEPGPAVVHELSAPVRLDTGGFYLAVAPVSKSGQPSSSGSSPSTEGHQFDALPAPDTEASHRHSFVGSPGRWALSNVEFSLGVLLTD